MEEIPFKGILGHGARLLFSLQHNNHLLIMVPLFQKTKNRFNWLQTETSETLSPKFLPLKYLFL